MRFCPNDYFWKIIEDMKKKYCTHPVLTEYQFFERRDFVSTINPNDYFCKYSKILKDTKKKYIKLQN